MQRTPITLKLALTLAVPLVVLALATTLGVRTASHERAEVRRQTELAGAAVGPAGLLTRLQNERLLVVTDVFGFQGDFEPPVTDYDEAHRQVDEARAALEDEVIGGSGVVARAFTPPLEGMDDLADLRADIDAFRAVTTHDLVEKVEFANACWARYNALITPFLDATSSVIVDIEDSDLRRGTRLSDNVARGIEVFTMAASRAVNIALLTENGVDTREEIAELATLQGRLRKNSDAIEKPGGRYADLSRIPDAVQQMQGVDATVDEALNTGRMDMEAMFAGIQMPQGEGLYGLQDEVHGLIDKRVEHLDAQASTRERWLIGLALAGLAFVIGLDLLVSWSVTRPLRSLTRQAKHVAQERLPSAVGQLLDVPVGTDVAVPEVEPVSIDSGDELAEVATALNTVQTSVVGLAAQQALYRRNISDLFVSLNGRNQELLRRQIGLIGELDSGSATPALRASMSQLDHLATQMRRNTESLLAVAGVDARRVWQAPVDIDEVVSYALGEVADTRRIVVHDREPAGIAGAAAGDVVHLLAELLEGALEASAPEQRGIELRGGPKHETGGYWLAVIDFGAVLTPREVQVANHQLGYVPPAASLPAGGPSPFASASASLDAGPQPAGQIGPGLGGGLYPPSPGGRPGSSVSSGAFGAVPGPSDPFDAVPGPSGAPPEQAGRASWGGRLAHLRNTGEVQQVAVGGNGVMPNGLPDARGGGMSGATGYTLAGHLAQRAGVSVRLDSSAGWGVTITVDIPPTLMVRRPSAALDPHFATPVAATTARPLPGTTMAPLPPRPR